MPRKRRRGTARTKRERTQHAIDPGEADRHAQWVAELREKVHEGFEQAVRGELLDGAEVFARIYRSLDAMQANAKTR